MGSPPLSSQNPPPEAQAQAHETQAQAQAQFTHAQTHPLWAWETFADSFPGVACFSQDFSSDFLLNPDFSSTFSRAFEIDSENSLPFAARPRLYQIHQLEGV
jgi:hypothetical protein